MDIWFDFPLSEGEFVDEFESRLEKLIFGKGKVKSSGIAASVINECR